MTVYLDLVVLLNFLVDLLLLLGTNRLAGFRQEWPRLLAASALGGVYSGLCLLRPLRFLGGTLWRIVCLAGMAAAAFGWNLSALRRGAVFVLLSFALGGMAAGFGRGDLFSPVLGAAGIWLLCRGAFGNAGGGREYVTLDITYGGETVSLTALRDTGNTLRDPITGEQVLIISPEAAQTLTGLTARQLRAPLETLAGQPIPGLRLIPYRAVGSTGMLLALRFEHVVIGSRRQSAIVAFAPEGLGGSGYQALLGGTV